MKERFQLKWNREERMISNKKKRVDNTKVKILNLDEAGWGLGSMIIFMCIIIIFIIIVAVEIKRVDEERSARRKRRAADQSRLHDALFRAADVLLSGDRREKGGGDHRRRIRVRFVFRPAAKKFRSGAKKCEKYLTRLAVFAIIF